MMNVILYFFSLCFFICSIILGFNNNPTEMGLAIIGGSLCLSFANIDKIQRFKGAGFEAEMKIDILKELKGLKGQELSEKLSDLYDKNVSENIRGK